MFDLPIFSVNRICMWCCAFWDCSSCLLFGFVTDAYLCWKRFLKRLGAFTQNLYVGRWKWALVEVACWLKWAYSDLCSECVGVMVSLELKDGWWECVFILPPTSYNLRIKCKYIWFDVAPFLIKCHICA